MLTPTIHEVARKEIDTDWDYRNMCQPFWRAYLNASSGACVRVSGRVTRIDAGRVWVVPAWVRFDCWATGSIDHRYLHFSLEGLPGVVSRRVFDRPMSVDRARLAGDPWASDGGGVPAAVREAAARAWAMSIVTIAFERLGPAALEACGPMLAGSARMRPVIQRIDRELHRPLSNEQLAAEARLDRKSVV